MVVGLIGAFLTAAYMTRCVYLTFFGEYRGHGHPHESERAITIPLVILAGLSIVAGLLNAAPFGIEKFTEWVEPADRLPRRSCTPTSTTRSPPSRFAIAAIGLGVGAYYFWFRREELRSFKGLTQRNRVAHAGYAFLDNKYYLDDLYENVIVDGIRGPIARASVLVQPARHRRCRQRGGAGCRKARAASPTTSSTNASSTARSTASHRDRHGGRRAPQGPVGPCAALRADPLRRRRRCSRSPCSSPTSPSGGDGPQWTGSMTGR